MGSQATQEKLWTHKWRSVETASDISHKLQQVGRRIIASGKIVEIHPNLFSTSSVPGESSADVSPRLLARRDTGKQLVEVTVLPIDDSPESLRRLFGDEERIVLDILWSRCKELPDRGDWISRIEGESVGLVGGEGFAELTSAWSHFNLSGFAPERLAKGGQPYWTQFNIYEGVPSLESRTDYLFYSAVLETTGVESIA